MRGDRRGLDLEFRVFGDIDVDLRYLGKVRYVWEGVQAFVVYLLWGMARKGGRGGTDGKYLTIGIVTLFSGRVLKLHQGGTMQ